MSKNEKKFEGIDLSRKKKKVFDVDNNLKVTQETGGLIYGKNQVLKHLRRNKVEMLITANNIPYDLMSELRHINSLLDDGDEIFIYQYKGSSWDLGLALGKPYMVSILAVTDYGDSELKSLKTKGN
jgi:large subunit ribosomal protein L30e